MNKCLIMKCNFGASVRSVNVMSTTCYSFSNTSAQCFPIKIKHSKGSKAEIWWYKGRWWL